ncbi:MAG TPA: helix-turn-helix transcriptional regulator [Edaphobacter sp.]|nr:helix-turn-helix transcriptional regulator [Edaphobacter sp.]
MQTHIIDKRTDRALQECLRIDRPVAVLSYDYASGHRVPRHQHSKSQLIYAIEGTMTVTTQKGEWVLLPTRAAWIPANVYHSIHMRSILRMRTVYFDSTVIAPAKSCAIVEVSPLLRELILSMLNEPRVYPKNSRAEHIAALICSELRFSHTLPLHLPCSQEPRLRKICEAMQRKPSLAGSIDFWANQVNISSRTLARLFRTELNMSFQEWRQQLLLLEAQIRLAQDQTSSRIARVLGYDSHAAFCAMFRRSLGLSPSQYLTEFRDKAGETSQRSM